MKHVTPREAEALLAAGGVELIDVREPREWANGHLPGARHVPLDTLRVNPSEKLPKDRPVMFVCAKGGRSQTAAGLADQLGLAEVYTIDGGTEEWARLGLPIEVPARAPVAPAVAEPPPDDMEAVMPELDAVIGANLRELRTQRSLSLDATARLTGLSRATLGQIELGTNTPSVGVVWKIARAFEVPFAALLAAHTKVTTAVLRSDKKVHSRVVKVLNDPARKPFELELEEPLMSPVCQLFPFNDIKENRCPQTTECTGSLAAKGTRFLAVVARRKVGGAWLPWEVSGTSWTSRWMAVGRQLDRFQLADDARIAQLEEYFKAPK